MFVHKKVEQTKTESSRLQLLHCSHLRIARPCAWSDTSTKPNMRTFLKELILPIIFVSNTNISSIKWEYHHTVS